MVEQNEIYRKVALERLSSPEQLDELMVVTSRRGWLALAALAAVVLLALGWGAFGDVPTKVYGRGILILPDSIFEIYAEGGGRVVEMELAEGDVVSEGQTVARIAQQDLDERIRQAEAELEELARKHRQTIELGDRRLALRAELLAQQRLTAEGSIGFAEERIASLERKLRAEKKLVEQGLSTELSQLSTEQELFAAREELEVGRSRLEKLDVEALADRTRREQEGVASQLEVSRAERRLELLKSELEVAAAVVSPYRGRVLEIKHDLGAMVDRGDAILSLELLRGGERALQAVFYVPPAEGKKIRPGMEAQIIPATVKVEESGFLLGEVAYVSEFPATRQGMMRVLGNEQLVVALSGRGAPFAVYADLVSDPDHPTGYRWSSPRTEVSELYSGTLLRSRTVVKHQRPLSLVIPLFKKTLLGD